MKKLTDDEIMAAALKCPESEKVPLEVGDRVIALREYSPMLGMFSIPRGDQGSVTEYDRYGNWPIRIMWDSMGGKNLWGILGPIGKLVKRGSV